MYNSVKRKEPCGPPLKTLLLLPSYPSLSWIILVARIPPSRCDQERALRLDTGVHLKDENGCELIICLTTPFIHLKCAAYLTCAQHSSRHCWSDWRVTSLQWFQTLCSFHHSQMHSSQPHLSWYLRIWAFTVSLAQGERDSVF